MNENQVFPLLSRIIADALSISPDKVTRESTIFGDLGAESIDLLDIQFRIENEFHLTMDIDALPNSFGDPPAGDFQKILTVGALEQFLRQCLNHAGTL